MAIAEKKQRSRRSISKKTRFEVFKRDSFKCQYCGKSAPDVILHIDHIHPVSKGGGNDIMNYVTACESCNSGKSDNLLSDDSVMAKQRSQLERLNERREQLEQMLAWREGLRDIDDIGLKAAIDLWNNQINGFRINESGENTLKKYISKYGLECVLESIDLSSQYLEIGENKNHTQESVDKAFYKIGGICRMSLHPDWKRELYYIRGIARNRFNYVNENECIRLLEEAYVRGVDVEILRNITLQSRSWTAWHCDISFSMKD